MLFERVNSSSCSICPVQACLLLTEIPSLKIFVKYSRFTPSPSLDELYGLTLILRWFQNCSLFWMLSAIAFLFWHVGIQTRLLPTSVWICEVNINSQNNLRNIRLKMTLRITLSSPLTSRKDQLLLCYTVTVFSILFLKTSQYGAFDISSGSPSQCFPALTTKRFFSIVCSEYVPYCSFSPWKLYLCWAQRTDCLLPLCSSLLRI